MSKKVSKLVSFDKDVLRKGVQKSITMYNNKRSFSKYLETLINKDNDR